MPTGVTTGQLQDVMNTIIRETRYTQEYNAPSWQLIEKYKLPRGSDTIRAPKVGQFAIADLQDNEDIVDEQTLDLSYVDLTTIEHGAKIILTDKLVRQNGTTDLFRIVGKNFGMAAARKQDRDVQALYAGLNGGTAFGAAGATMSLSNWAGAIAKAKGGGASSTDSNGTEPFDAQYTVQHPHATFNVAKTGTAIGNSSAANTAVNDQREEKMLRDFFTGIVFNRCRLYESGNLYIDSSGDVTGCIAQRDAMVGVTSVGWRTERERDASLRATEVVFSSDYGVSELDDSHGAPLLYDASPPADSA